MTTRSRKIKCGIEIHQMLDTQSKLFCSCPTKIRKDPPDFTFLRRLRLARSEIGEIDPAALFEFEKGLQFLYEGYNDSVCLVEMDEEPPHPTNMEALTIALKFALLVNARIIDEIHVMRKIVIDGSNTTGFQRTMLVAVGGSINVKGKEIPIETICLEEDAARKIDERKDQQTVIYRLDRLGIPLIEVATGPVIESPEEAREVAHYIGLLLRSLGKVKRGLGTIRQDLNISVEGGARVEVKGVQYLDLIPLVVENEVKRQVKLLEIRDELVARGLSVTDILFEPVDVSKYFEKTKSKVARSALEKGGVALALKLKGFKGILGKEIQPGRRFGTELADRARYWARVGGIFHSDELPGYGISEEEVKILSEVLSLGENDAFVLVFDEREKALKALEAVYKRVLEAFSGVPEETRAANTDGTTRFMRPRPGKARMYPETDIRPIVISSQLIEKLKGELPEPPEETLKRLKKHYGLSDVLAQQLFSSEYLFFFEELVQETGVQPVIAATLLTNTLKSLRREGVNVEVLEEEHIKRVLKAVAENKLAKEAIPEVLRALAENPESSVEDVIEKLSLRGLTLQELERLVDEIISERKQLIMEKKEKAFSPIMGIVMEKVRGKIDGKIVAEVVRKKITEAISS
ncbi:MAG: Glu-tRNA(Gln) amidotransferase subunit GatE [Infirmifilum sp.]|jgi:glutamyl-tRNA(Gln) amidotransferase subunit E|uniref:Glu-tRNA(Gln) amidotransferase subunit GatE n=1 Tax=Infirmifilum sp. TaxID=2856575 RepID=UPI003D1360CC